MLQETTAHATHIQSVVQGTPPDASPDGRIARSWLRCIHHYGLDPVHSPPTQVLEQIRLREHQERLDDFLDIARIEINSLYQRIAGSGFAIILTDRDGVIINWTGDANLSKPFEEVGLWLGAIWNEENEGTNGIGTVLIEQQALTVHSSEHFRSRYTHLSCSAAPIFDPHNQLLAVLDISSVKCQDSRQSQLHTLALADWSAKMIEHCFFLRAFRRQSVLRFHHQPEFMGQGSEGLLAFDDSGRILAANQSAAAQLQQLRPHLVGQRIDALFTGSLDMLLGHSRHQPVTLKPLNPTLKDQFFVLLHKAEQPTCSTRLTGGALSRLNRCCCR